MFRTKEGAKQTGKKEDLTAAPFALKRQVQCLMDGPYGRKKGGMTYVDA